MNGSRDGTGGAGAARRAPHATGEPRGAARETPGAAREASEALSGASGATRGEAAAARSAERLLARLELPDAANELVAMVRFLTEADGPVQQLAASGLSSPWHERVLLKAQERIEVLDRFLRGRVAFFVAGRAQGYGSFDEELELAGAALDTCRAVAGIVERLLEGELPSERELDVMGRSVLAIFPAIDALEGR